MSKIFVTSITCAARSIVIDGGGAVEEASYGAWVVPHGWYADIPTRAIAQLAVNVGNEGWSRRLYVPGIDESFAGRGGWSKWDASM